MKSMHSLKMYEEYVEELVDFDESDTFENAIGEVRNELESDLPNTSAVASSLQRVGVKERF